MWKNANNSVMITIPKSFVDKYDLHSSEFVTVEDTSQGIVIKKLELE